MPLLQPPPPEIAITPIAPGFEPIQVVSMVITVLILVVEYLQYRDEPNSRVWVLSSLFNLSE